MLLPKNLLSVRWFHTERLLHRHTRRWDSRSHRPLTKLVHYAIRLNGPLPPAVLAGGEPIHLNIFLPAPLHITTPSPTSLSLSFPLPIPPCLASPSHSISNEDIIAEDERFSHQKDHQHLHTSSLKLSPHLLPSSRQKTHSLTQTCTYNPNDNRSLT